MIKEVSIVKPKQITRGYDVILEWMEDTAKYFNVPVVMDTSYDSYGQNSSIYFHASEIPPTGIKAVIKSARNSLGQMFPVLRRLTMKKRMLSYSNHSIPDLEQNISSPLSVYYMASPLEISVCSHGNCLPIYIDVWHDSIKYVAESTKNLKLFYVTSRAVYDLIKAENPDSNVRYMPLSVSDRYFSPNFEKYRHKTIDVIRIGRRDSLLHEYMLRYTNEHKDVEYVYAGTDGKYSCYISTTRGNIGENASRDDFINTLASAKISLVSPPGMDRKNPQKYGINFPTPRFYESAVLGCSLIGRYPDNEEFRELNMSRYCPNITSYEQFVHELERALAMTPEELYAQNHDFIINSLTSKRAEQIRKDLEALTCQNS